MDKVFQSWRAFPVSPSLAEFPKSEFYLIGIFSHKSCVQTVERDDLEVEVNAYKIVSLKVSCLSVRLAEFTLEHFT